MSGFQSPNYTQAPNDFFDMLAGMSEAELRVTLVMIRQTFGFHRDDFKLGIKKLAKAAGLSPQGVRDGAEAAEKRGTFRRTNPDAQGEAEWELVVPLQPVDPPLNPVEAPPPASGVQVGVKERLKKDSKKGNLLDGMVHYAQEAKEQDSAELYASIGFKLSEGFRLGEFPQSLQAQQVYKWIAAREKEGQKLEVFIAWVMQDEKRAAYAFMYHKNPADIKRDWPRVFPKNSTPQGGSFYG